MKKKSLVRYSMLLACTFTLMLNLSVSTFACDENTQPQSVSIVELSQEEANKFYLAALENTPSFYDGEEVENINGGTVAYSNGYVKQTVITRQVQPRDGYSFASATDHWYRDFTHETPVCTVSIWCKFNHNGTVATCDKGAYEFSYDIPKDMDGIVFVNETSTTFKDGRIGSPSARVDCKYRVEYFIYPDNETISMECDKDGLITTWEQTELI